MLIEKGPIASNVSFFLKLDDIEVTFECTGRVEAYASLQPRLSCESLVCVCV